MAKLRYFVPNKCLLNLYNAFIQPHLDYGALVWGNSAQIHTKKIQNIQNKIIRIINFQKKNANENILYKNSKLLPFTKNHNYLMGKFLWRLIHGIQPDTTKKLFIDHGATLSNNINNHFRMKLPYQKTNYGQNFIIFNGIKNWNQYISNHITKITKKNNFQKKNYKSFLLSSL